MYDVKLINNNVETYINVTSTDRNAPRITGSIKQGINAIDSFTFDIHPNNPGYTQINPFKTLVEVENSLTGRIEFRGRVLITKPSLDSSGELKTSVVCESELGYLMDSSVVYAEYHDISVRDYLKKLIDNHNSQVDKEKHFEVGIVDVESNLFRQWGYNKSFDALKEDLLDKLGGELRVRNENGFRYLDYLTEIGESKETVIQLTKNLITIEQERDPSEIISRLIPLGAKLSDDTEERLTIHDINNGNIYVDDEEAIAAFGIICGTKTWDDVTLSTNLIRKGKEFQQENNRIKKSHKITAADLALIGLDLDTFEVGNYYPIINPLMGIDEKLRVISKTIVIESPETSILEVGDKFEDIKDYQIQTIKTGNELNGVKNTVQTTVKSITTISSELIKTAEVLQGTNATMTGVVEVLNTNLEITDSILNELEVLNKKLVRMNKRLVLEVQVMEEFLIIANQTLSNTEEVIYSNSRGSVVKTILLSAPAQTEAILVFDEVPFSFLIEKETTIISTPILTKKIKASGDGVNLHITGLQLQG